MASISTIETTLTSSTRIVYEETIEKTAKETPRMMLNRQEIIFPSADLDMV